MPTQPPKPPAIANDADNPDAEAVSAASRAEFLRWLEDLRHADRAFYNLMALEVWAIAQTMDALIPGFWSRFMHNRQTAMREFIQQRRDMQPDVAKVTQPVQPNAGDNGKIESSDCGSSPVDDPECP